MKRIMYLDKNSNEIDNLLNGSKDIIIRAANIKKYPYQMIQKDYLLYLLRNDSSEKVYCSAVVEEAIFHEISSESEMSKLLKKYEERVKLSKKKLDYIRKRKYISIFILKQIKSETGKIDHSQFGIVDDWVRLLK